MKIYKANRVLTLLISILFSFSLCACIPVDKTTSAEEQIPQADAAHTYSGGDPIYISGDTTIKLENVNISGQAPPSQPASDSDKCKASPITIASGTTNIILSGNNTLTAMSDYASAGIYVKYGATVNIYAEDGGTLNVTGGNYGAGIGGVKTGGYDSGIPGTINIYSGTLFVQGGSDAAGIGSGRNSSGNEINIYGGDITAISGGNGAGIGSGYGTSGGSGAPLVGQLTGGEINITGGTVRAAAGKFKPDGKGNYYSFNNFDIYNTDYFFENCYENNGFGAGIGGGYGAASGKITIGGEANVTAIGSGGGAGIGAGRGTSSKDKYDKDCTPIDITITDDATVVAATPNENRDKQKPGSGAAIGGGRGFNDGGTIKILENANVTAVSTNYKNVQDIAYQDNAGSSYAAAIGGSWKVGSIDTSNPELIAKPGTLQIDPTATISAVSDGFVPAISLPQTIDSLVTLNISDDFFTNNSDVLDSTKPLKIEAQNLDNGNTTTFSVNNSLASCLINLPGEKFRLKVIDEDSTEKIYLSNSNEENSANFVKSKSYNISGLTSPIEQETTIKNGEEDLKIKVKGDAGIFEYGATFYAEGVNDPAQIEELNEDLDSQYKDKLERIHYFDIGVIYRQEKNDDGTPKKYEKFTGGPVTISLQVPSGWDKEELLAIYVTMTDDETFNHRIETIDGVDYISFETTHFSKYAIFDPDTKVEFPPTGDPLNALVMALISLFFKSFSSMFMIYLQK